MSETITCHKSPMRRVESRFSERRTMMPRKVVVRGHTLGNFPSSTGESFKKYSMVIGNKIF